MNIDYLLEKLRSDLGITPEQEEKMMEEIRMNSPLSNFAPKVKSPSEIYEEVYNNPNSTLDEIKQAKIEVLRVNCQEDILSGFTYNLNGFNYSFSFDTEAQSNFLASMLGLQTGLLTTVPEWTVRVNGVYQRIQMTPQEFSPVALESFTQKDEKIAKLRNFLIPIVVDSTDKEQVNSVVW